MWSAIAFQPGGAVGALADPVEIFSNLWDDYQTFCGQIIADPESGFTTLSEVADGRLVQWGITETGNEASVAIVSDDYALEASFHLIRNGDDFDIACEARYTPESGLDVDVAEVAIREELAARSIAVEGGAYLDVPESPQSLGRHADYPWVALSIKGVFPGYSAVTKIDIDPEQLALTTSGQVMVD